MSIKIKGDSVKDPDLPTISSVEKRINLNLREDGSKIKRSGEKEVPKR